MKSLTGFVTDLAIVLWGIFCWAVFGIVFLGVMSWALRQLGC